MAPRPAPDEVQLVALPDAVAAVVAGALESEGIGARCERDVLGTVYGLNAGAFATRVLVARADLPRAQALLDEIEAGDT